MKCIKYKGIYKKLYPEFNIYCHYFNSIIYKKTIEL